MKKIKKMFLLLFSSLACTLIISNSITNGAEKEKKWGDFIPIGVEVTPWETIFPQLVVNWNLATNEAVGTAYYHVGITKRIMVLNYFIFCKSFAPFTGIVKFDKYVDQLANNYPSATTAADNIANDTTQPWNKTRALLALKAFDDTIKNASSATLSKEFSDAYLYVLQNFDLIYNAPFGFLVAFISNDPENEYYLGINIRYNFDPELTDISKNATESIRNPVIIQVPTNSTSCLDLVENSNGILDTTVSTYN
ncbi:MAG: hypothetical protein WCR55_14520, partial [Lentisphaerota bacterium]